MRAEWPEELSEADEKVLKLCRKQKLWAFLRKHRHRLFDKEVAAALQRMYRPAGVGRLPIDVRQKALAMLLQVAFDVPDHEVPALTVVDARWQMVLGCQGIEDPLMEQGTVFDFRMRAMQSGAMSMLLEKTVALARESGGFSHKRLRAIIDSSPMLGAGRVEDTVNLIGRAVCGLAEVAAQETGRSMDEIVEEAGIDLVGSSSVKAWLDIDWRSAPARAEAVTRLVEQFDRLRAWLTEQVGAERVGAPPLGDHVRLVEQLIEQDTDPEPDPEGPAVAGEEAPHELAVERPSEVPPAKRGRQIRDGVAPDRVISLSDRDMRHGRKSRTKVFNGYKRHVVADADVPGLICATDVVAANVQDHEPVGTLIGTLALRGFEVIEVHADRGYLPSRALHDRRRTGLRLLCKPPADRSNGRFSKSVFYVDFTKGVVTCPAGHTAPADPQTRFPAKTCGACPLRTECTDAKGGRVVTLHPEEQYHREMAARLATTEGRREARERVQVEHVLARVEQIQGRRARFRGIEKNRFDLERVAVVNNWYVLGRMLEAA